MYHDSVFAGRPGDLTVGMAGTFDVENYGDLLFPLIAAEALRRRDPRIGVAPFSVNARAAPGWPFAVHALDDLAARLPSLSALLIGGGQLIRFDPTYPVPVPANADMPLAYWLHPAANAARAGVPLIWNGVGAWTGSPRAPWHDETVRQVFAASQFIGIRDSASLDYLEKIAPGAETAFLPDTAFGLSRLWPLGEERESWSGWRDSLGLEEPYVVIQASRLMQRHGGRIVRAMEKAGVRHAVSLPICRCHGDGTGPAWKLDGQRVANADWLPPRLIAEIIARSEFLFASSLHACITALSYGVPAARPVSRLDRKMELLDGFEGIAPIEDEEAIARLIRAGRRLEPRVLDFCDRLDDHWDRVADAVLRPRRRDTAPCIGVTSARSRGAGAIVRPAMRAFEEGRMALRIRRAALSEHILGWMDKAREASRGLSQARPGQRRNAGSEAHRPPPSAPILNLDLIGRRPMNGAPYRWAAIDGLFSADDAARLAAAFPTDRFRDVAGHDGEKGFQYAARSLIHMGASEPSHPSGLDPSWLALAGDLLSPEYRDALSRTSGLDLSAADMEANVVHYGPGAWLGPHVDLKEKILTHIFYFNTGWDPDEGGCLNILASKDPDDLVAEIQPLVGNSSLLVRSDRSWHSVSPVASGCATSRRSLNVIFHLPGSVSTMWPPRRRVRLRDYTAAG